MLPTLIKSTVLVQCVIAVVIMWPTETSQNIPRMSILFEITETLFIPRQKMICQIRIKIVFVTYKWKRKTKQVLGVLYPPWFEVSWYQIGSACAWHRCCVYEFFFSVETTVFALDLGVLLLMVVVVLFYSMGVECRWLTNELFLKHRRSQSFNPSLIYSPITTPW